jgi:uncharacterized membrane protein
VVQSKELALAMGLEMATARIGTALALATSVPIAKAFGHVSKPILFALILLVIGLISLSFTHSWIKSSMHRKPNLIAK